MRVDTITVQRFGAFYHPFEIKLDPHVTILTGGNDVGKTSLLSAIELALSNRPMNESQGNHIQLEKNGGIPPTSDPEITTTAKFIVADASDLQGSNQLKLSPEAHLLYKRKLGRDVAEITHAHQFENYGPNHDFKVKLPAIIRPSAGNEFLTKSEIALDKPSALDLAFLRLAFSESFNFGNVSALQRIPWIRQVELAQQRVNDQLRNVLPKVGTLRFRLLHDVGGQRERLGVTLEDAHGAVTPFGDRGAGVRRVIGLLVELLTTGRGAHHKIVILDEPENSLHADAQHLMREFLFSLTADHRTQVIYATHSPAMINPLRGQHVRLLMRSKIDELPTTTLVARPEEENFLKLRLSWGVSAVDSLLYAPVTVIAEGSTEVRNLPGVFRKLFGSPAFAGLDVEKLLGLTTFLDGNGDSVPYLARLAQAQGTQVVKFLDGDKRPAQEPPAPAEGEPPSIATVYLPGRTEFEELVPSKYYLQALSTLTEVNLGADPTADFERWVAAEPTRASPGYSKRVEMWFRTQNSTRYPTKKILMEKAIDLTPSEEMNAAPFRELLQQIGSLLANTSFR